MNSFGGLSLAEVAANLKQALAKRCRQRARERLKKGEGSYHCSVWCGEKQVMDSNYKGIRLARARMRWALEFHGAKVTAWQIIDETDDYPVRVAGAVEVES